MCVVLVFTRVFIALPAYDVGRWSCGPERGPERGPLSDSTTCSRDCPRDCPRDCDPREGRLLRDWPRDGSRVDDGDDDGCRSRGRSRPRPSSKPPPSSEPLVPAPCSRPRGGWPGWEAWEAWEGEGPGERPPPPPPRFLLPPRCLEEGRLLRLFSASRWYSVSSRVSSRAPLPPGMIFGGASLPEAAQSEQKYDFCSSRWKPFFSEARPHVESVPTGRPAPLLKRGGAGRNGRRPG